MEAIFRDIETGIEWLDAKRRRIERRMPHGISNIGNVTGGGNIPLPIVEEEEARLGL